MADKTTSYIAEEANLILECKKCGSLFRKLPPFLEHVSSSELECTKKEEPHCVEKVREPINLYYRTTTRKDITSLFNDTKQVTENVQTEETVLENMVPTNEGFLDLRYESQQDPKEENIIEPDAIPGPSGMCTRSSAVHSKSSPVEEPPKHKVKLKLSAEEKKRQDEAFMEDLRRSFHTCSSCGKQFATRVAFRAHSSQCHKPVVAPHDLQRALRRKQLIPMKLAAENINTIKKGG